MRKSCFVAVGACPTSKQISGAVRASPNLHESHLMRKFPSIKRAGVCKELLVRVGFILTAYILTYDGIKILLHPHLTRDPFIHIGFKDVEGDGAGAEDDIVEGANIE